MIGSFDVSEALTAGEGQNNVMGNTMHFKFGRSAQQSVADGLKAEELCASGDGITYKWVA